MDDIESDWVDEKDQYELIHARYLVISIRDFGKLIKRCYQYVIRTFPPFYPGSLTEFRSVKPGGWVEFQDWDGYPLSEDGSIEDTGFKRYYNKVFSAFEKAGYETRPGPKLEQWFKDAGFVNVHVERLIIPYGVWPKDPHLVGLSSLSL